MFRLKYLQKNEWRPRWQLSNDYLLHISFLMKDQTMDAAHNNNNAAVSVTDMWQVRLYKYYRKCMSWRGGYIISWLRTVYAAFLFKPRFGLSVMVIGMEEFAEGTKNIVHNFNSKNAALTRILCPLYIQSPARKKQPYWDIHIFNTSVLYKIPQTGVVTRSFFTWSLPIFLSFSTSVFIIRIKKFTLWF